MCKLARWVVRTVNGAFRLAASLPAAQSPSADLTPAQAAHTLSTLLTARGIPGISRPNGSGSQSVVSIAAGLTVRCRDGIFQWLADGWLAEGVRQRAFFDLAGTVEDIIRLHEDLVSS